MGEIELRDVACPFEPSIQPANMVRILPKGARLPQVPSQSDKLPSRARWRKPRSGVIHAEDPLDDPLRGCIAHMYSVNISSRSTPRMVGAAVGAVGWPRYGMTWRN